MSLGQRLYDLRKTTGLSQEKAAEQLGVTRQTVSKWGTDHFLFFCYNCCCNNAYSFRCDCVPNYKACFFVERN